MALRQSPRPPRFPNWLLNLFLEDQQREFILGDLQELWQAKLRSQGWLQPFQFDSIMT